MHELVQLQKPTGLNLQFCSDHPTVLTLTRHVYSISNGDYDLFNGAGERVMKVRGTAISPDYRNTFYDSKNNEIFRVWTPEPFNRAFAYAPGVTDHPIWRIVNDVSLARRRLVLRYTDVGTKTEKVISLFKLEERGGLEFTIDGDMVAVFKYENPNDFWVHRVEIASIVDLSLIIAMAVTLNTFGGMASINH